MKSDIDLKTIQIKLLEMKKYLLKIKILLDGVNRLDIKNQKLRQKKIYRMKHRETTDGKKQKIESVTWG